mgnify:CR=1 FL=1
MHLNFFQANKRLMIIDIAKRLGATKEYYFSVKLQEIRKMIAEGKDVINIAIGSPDLPPSEETINSLIENVKNPRLHDYPPYQGLPQLRKSIKKWCESTYNIQLDEESEILPLIGSKEGITHISLTFLDPGDEVLVPELGYPAYRAVTEMIGAIPRIYELDENNNWQPNLSALENEDLSRVKLMWVNYPHMPTGASIDINMFEKLIEFAKRHHILLCHDNPYSLVLNTNDPISILSIPGAKDVALELHSFSKSHNMAGWRIGWLAGQKDYIYNIFKVKSNVDTGIFKPLQLAAARALENTKEWHDERNETYRRRRSVAYDILDLLGCQYDRKQVGMFIWARLPEGTEAKEFIDHLLYNYLVFIAPGFIFGEKGKNYIRVSLCVDEEVLNKVKDRLSGFDYNKM